MYRLLFLIKHKCNGDSNLRMSGSRMSGSDPMKYS